VLKAGAAKNTSLKLPCGEPANVTWPVTNHGPKLAPPVSNACVGSCLILCLSVGLVMVVVLVL